MATIYKLWQEQNEIIDNFSKNFRISKKDALDIILIGGN